ncbi:ribonuclease H-like domain-containing protein [Tanacetum coccineum]
MNQFCEKKGILRQFSVAITPQQNGVAERRNRTLIEAARTMLADSKLPTTFWAEAVNTACYDRNRSGTQSNGFAGTKASDNADPKSSHDDGSKPLSDDGKKIDEDPRKNIELPFDPNMSALEYYSIFDVSRDDEDDGAEADMNNLDTTIQEEPKKAIHALKDPRWIEAIQEELL